MHIGVRFSDNSKYLNYMKFQLSDNSSGTEYVLLSTSLF